MTGVQTETPLRVPWGAHPARAVPAAPLRMILALARCGLIATASTTASTIVFAQGILLDDRGLGIASGGADGGAMLLAPAVMLRVAIKRLSRRPPSGMWLAVSASCFARQKPSCCCS